MKVEIKLTGAPKDVAARLRQVMATLAAGLAPMPFPYISPGFVGDTIIPRVTPEKAAGYVTAFAPDGTAKVQWNSPCPKHPKYRAIRTPRGDLVRVEAAPPDQYEGERRHELAMGY